jgi:hypothetical protein
VDLPFSLELMSSPNKYVDIFLDIEKRAAHLIHFAISMFISDTKT